MYQIINKYLYTCDHCEKKEIVEANKPTLPEYWKHVTRLADKPEFGSRIFEVNKDYCDECQRELSYNGWELK